MGRMDFRSDTVTHPTAAMRKAMASAEVGDDVYQDDPTTNKLEALAAEVTGKEAALFVASGTMGNQLALMAHTERGQEAIVSFNSHIFEHEVGAAAVLSGLSMRALVFENGVYDAAQIEANIRGGDIHEAPTGIICLENALANGRVVPISVMREVQQVGLRHGIPVHMDGARLFNAAVALGVDALELASCVDSVQFCLSKGLRPVIAILPVTNYLYSRFTPEFIENHILAYIAEANEAKVPVKNYLTDERFTDSSLYINSFFFNTKGRKKFTKQFIEDLRAQSIL